MIFTDIKPQIEQLPLEEMQKALAFLKNRVRGDSDGNRRMLSDIHRKMDTGAKVRWEDLKRQLGIE
ncbi:MAG: hypothetical protein LBK99_07595 [Opitutaceae bacterium]|jgi:hypothetical protein|nr:hypothetical protein [Opitutaceae bacterium]